MWGTFQIEATTFHEGIPGHHLQIAGALENERLHPLLSRYYIAAYNEGWGLYTERLADEGLYSSDLDRVGMLSTDSMRAAAWSTPACTRSAGRGTGPSTSCSLTPR